MYKDKKVSRDHRTVGRNITQISEEQ